MHWFYASAPKQIILMNGLAIHCASFGCETTLWCFHTDTIVEKLLSLSSGPSFLWRTGLCARRNTENPTIQKWIGLLTTNPPPRSDFRISLSPRGRHHKELQVEAFMPKASSNLPTTQILEQTFNWINVRSVGMRDATSPPCSTPSGHTDSQDKFPTHKHACILRVDFSCILNVVGTNTEKRHN